MTDSSIGVWLNDDGTLGKPDPSNPRRYVGNSPTNATDPTGLAETTPYQGLLWAQMLTGLPDELPLRTWGKSVLPFTLEMQKNSLKIEDLIARFNKENAQGSVTGGIASAAQAESDRQTAQAFPGGSVGLGVQPTVDRLIAQAFLGTGVSGAVSGTVQQHMAVSRGLALVSGSAAKAGQQLAAMSAWLALQSGSVAEAGQQQVGMQMMIGNLALTARQPVLEDQQFLERVTKAKPAISFSAIAYTGGTQLQIDTSDTKDEPLDKKADSTPFIYARGSSLSVNAQFTKNADVKSVDIVGRILNRTAGATGFQTMGYLKKTDVATNGDPFSVTSTRPFQTVGAYDKLDIQWYVSADKGATYQEAGTSKKKIYVTYGEPALSPGSDKLLETFVAYGSRGAAGKSDPKDIVAGIWSNFEGKAASRAADGKPLYYYGSPLLPKYANQAPDPKNDSARASELVQGQTGKCQAWSELFLAAVYAQGLADAKGKLVGTNDNVQVVEISPKPELQRAWMMINPGWSGTKDGTPTSGINTFNGLKDDLGTWHLSGKKGWAINWIIDMPQANKYESAKDNVGQNQPFPPGMFPNHYIVRIGTAEKATYYDPSYGGEPFTGSEKEFLKAFQKKAIYGFATLSGGGTPQKPTMSMGVTVNKNLGEQLQLKVAK